MDRIQIEVVMKRQKIFQTNKVEYTCDIDLWHSVTFNYIALANEIKMIRWLMSRIQGRWARLGPYIWTFYFELEEDAILFKLTWLDIGEINNSEFNWL